MELAAAKLAISTLSPIINKLGTYVSDSYLGGDVTAEEMNSLDVFARFKITEFIRVAELDHSDGFRKLLEEVQVAALEAEDVLDLYEYKQIKHKVSSSPNLIKKSVGIFKKKFAFMLPKSSLRISLEKLLKFVDQLEKLPPFIKSTTDMTQQNYKSPETTSNRSSPYFGRAKQCDIIVEFLLDESHADSKKGIKRVPTIAIHGLGGSGKTHTAQHVYNDDKIKNYFDLRMWVHVSRSFDVLSLTKKIIESAKYGECPQINSLDVLQGKLKELISNRNKFLLVLDDIWCDEKDDKMQWHQLLMQWDQLLSPLNEVGGNGSKIIITTRMKEVASKLHVEKIILLEELKTEDCWSILKHYAFNNHEEIIEDQELVDVGNQIISKVKYSPLALRIVASTLIKGKRVNEWKKILERDMLKEIMDVLLFSFQHLPSHLQRCFAYCSLFPKGYTFYFKQQSWCAHLIDLWIAQGFIENTSDERTLEEEGSRYIEELLSYSFFEKDSHSGGFIIHDLLHDLAEKVSKKLCHRIEHPNTMEIPTTCIHLSFCPSNPIEEWESIDISDIFKRRNIRSLIIFEKKKNILQNLIKQKKEDILQNLTKLRTLHVESEEPMVVLNVDKLKQLRYLCVQYNDEKLPGSLTKLYLLQFLYLLTITKHMSLEGPYCLDDILPKGFGNLINLRTFKFYEQLSIEGYQGAKVANWMVKGNWFQHLTDLSLSSCKSLKEVPFLPSYLKILIVENCDELMQLPPPVNTLRELKLKNCPKLMLPSIFSNKSLRYLEIKRCSAGIENQLFIELPCLTNLKFLELEGFPNLQTLPNLSPTVYELSIEDCPKLTCLGNLQYCTSLQYLTIKKCPMLMRDKQRLLVEGVVKGDIANPLSSQIKHIDITTDEPLLVLVLVPQQAFSSIWHLNLYGLQRPFPPLLEDHFHQLSPLSLDLHDFTTLPNLEKLSSLVYLDIIDCPNVERLPNLPISLSYMNVRGCPKLKENYEEGGQLRHTISHVPNLCFSE